MHGCGLFSFGIFGCLCPGCGRGLIPSLLRCRLVLIGTVLGFGFRLSIICSVCGLGLFGWFAYWLVLFLYRADARFPMFIGEVLSVFRFLWEPASCNC